MAHKALDTYLNDHLAGSSFGAELAAQIRDHAEGSMLATTMAEIHGEIEKDVEALKAVIDALDVSPNPVKKAAGWVAEKGSRLKFSGLTSGDDDHGLFVALETLALGVLGKASLWSALREVEADHPSLDAADLDRLITRAQEQYAVLERERLAAARRTLHAD